MSKLVCTPVGMPMRLVANSRHNAFTSLVAYDGLLYLAYREGQGHNPQLPGVIRLRRTAPDLLLLREPDPDAYWMECATLATGGDDRDPRLFVAQDGRLGCLWGTYYPTWGFGALYHQTIPLTQHTLVSHVSFTEDGTHWTTPVQCYAPNYWLWSLEWCAEFTMYLAGAYHWSGQMYDETSLCLLSSKDAIGWTKLADVFRQPRYYPSEPMLFWYQGQLLCLFRDGDYDPTLLLDLTAITRTSKQEVPIAFSRLFPQTVLHAPAVLMWRDYCLVTGRVCTKIAYETVPPLPTDPRWQQRVQMFTLDMTGDDPHLSLLDTLPSDRDCGYCGMVVEGNTLWVSYYSQHAYPKTKTKSALEPADIYLAQYTLSEE